MFAICQGRQPALQYAHPEQVPCIGYNKDSLEGGNLVYKNGRDYWGFIFCNLRPGIRRLD